MIIRLSKQAPFIQLRSGLSNPADWFRKFVEQGTTVDSGISVTEKTALNYSSVFACVKVLSESMATMPLYLVKRTLSGTNLITNNPVNKLIRKPYKNLNLFNFLQYGQVSIELWGNFYARIYFENDRPVSIKPWHPSKVEIKEEKGEIYYIYENEPYPAREVFHVSGMVIDADSLKGISPISAARQSIGLGLAADKFGAKFFGNGAHFNSFLKTDQKLNDKQYENLSKTWNNRHASPDKWFDTPILEAGLELKSIGIPPEDAQFLQTRLFQIQEVSRFYRTPLHMINELSRSTNNNIEHQSLEFIKYTMTPKVVAWVNELNDKLLTTKELDEGITFKFGLEALMTNDPKTQADKLTKLVFGGIYTPNEAREELNRNPMPDGDTLFVPSQLTVLDNILNSEPQNTDNNNRKEDILVEINKMLNEKIKINGQEQ